MYVLPDELRERLKEPLGFLLDEKGLIEALAGKKIVVSVGDMVTFTLLKHGVKPNIAVFDFKCRRRVCRREMKEVLEEYGDVRLRVKNQPATISKELWEAIKKAYSVCSRKKVSIVVDGEEDLASLAAISLAPSDVTVIYGLPDKGVLLIDVTEKEKKIVNAVLNRCGKHGDRSR